MIKNTAGQNVGVQMVTAADGSAFTGAVTVAVTGDAGTQATGSVGSGACVHEGGGYHTYAPAQAETNYDLVAFTFTGTGAVPQTVQVYTRAATPDVNAAQVGGETVSSPGTAYPFGVIDQGTAQSAAGTSLVLRAAAGFADDELIGATILITGGSTGVGQRKVILDYVGATDTATVSAWTTTPTGTITYKIFGSAAGEGVAQTGDAYAIVNSGTHGNAALKAILDTSGVVLANGAIATGKIADGAFTAAKFASGAFDAVWSVAARLLTAGTNIVLAKGTGVTGFNDLSAAQVNAEADAALADYDGPTAAEIPSAGAVASQVRTELSTELGRVDAAVSTRATPAQVAAELVTYDAPTKAELDAGFAALTIPTADQNADALLARDLGSGTGAGSLNERTVRSALRFNRNKFTIAGGVLTVYREDDATIAFTAAITQTAGDPVSASDPV